MIKDMEKYVAPSLLSADKNKLLDEVLLVESFGATYIHVDVMDGVFVPNTAITLKHFNSFAKKHSGINDVHIMVSTPFEYAEQFIKSGANIITFHYEALTTDEKRYECIKFIKDKKCKVGMSIKPNTDVSLILPFLKELDLVLIMSVEPGKGGQSFIPDALNKIKACREYIDSHNLKTLVEVDGGINSTTSKDCFISGANILVAGSYLYGHDDILERYKSLLK